MPESVTNRKMGPQTVPRIKCGKCGTGHHPDAANGEYLGRCRECSAFLPRPTETQQRRFTDFIAWKSQFVESNAGTNREDEQ